jgi:hypothetical protein
MLLRSLIVALVLLVVPIARGTPLDTGHDMLQAVEYGDGAGFLGLLSASLSAQMEAGYLQLRELAETDPSLAEGLLSEAGIEATAFEVQWMSFEDFAGRVLEDVNLPSVESLISEEASLKGRNADVLFKWSDGSSLDLQMVWEESDWRITGSPLLARFFR